MENQPTTSPQEVDLQIDELLRRASERFRQDPLSADSEGYKSVEDLIRGNLSSWEYGDESNSSSRHRQRRQEEPVEPSNVQDTREILALPEDELNKFGPDIFMLKGYLAKYDKDKEAAIWHFDLAQSGYLKNDDLSSYAKAAEKLARTAREAGFASLAIAAHGNAIEGHMQVQELANFNLISKGKLIPQNATPYNVYSFYEYRRLAKTLGRRWFKSIAR